MKSVSPKPSSAPFNRSQGRYSYRDKNLALNPKIDKLR